MWDLKATDIQALHLAFIALIGGAYRMLWYLQAIVTKKIARVEWFQFGVEVMTGVAVSLFCVVMLLSYADRIKVPAAAAMSWLAAFVGTKTLIVVWRWWVKRTTGIDPITQSKGDTE
jgi:hypothetical protein